MSRSVAALLLCTLLAGPLAALAPGEGSRCRCTDHLCCQPSKGATFCPLRRSGKPCGMPAAPRGEASLRADCGCGHGGPPGTTARDEPALRPRLASLPPRPAAVPARSRLETTPSDLVRTPDSPPPRAARFVA